MSALLRRSVRWLVRFLLSIIVTGLLMYIGGADIKAGFIALFEGAFGSWQAVVESLVKATPLILTGLATVVAFRARIWNIGQEGQLYVGAITAYWAYLQFNSLSPVILIPIIILFALIGGALCGLVPAVIKAKFGVDEIIITIMLNYIVIYFLSWLLSGPWKDPNHYYQQSPIILDKCSISDLACTLAFTPGIFRSNCCSDFDLSTALKNSPGLRDKSDGY